MKKLDLYIIRKFLGTFFFILAIIIVVSIVIDIAEKIDDFIEKKPPIRGLILDYYLNFIIFFGNLLSPICIFLAVIFFTSRLTQNTEIVAMLTGGISFYRVLGTYLFTAVLLAGASFYLNAYMVPRANASRIDFEYKYLKGNKLMRDVNIHKKVASDPAAGTESFVYLYSFNQILNEGYMFSMELVKDGDIVRKLTGSKINWNDSTETWRVSKVKMRDFFPDGTERLTYRDYLDTTFLLTPEDIFIKEMRAESLPLDELYTAIDKESERGSGLAEELVVEKYERFAYPFAAIILTMIGFSVSTKKRRGGTPLSLGIGLVISFQYVLLVVVGQAIFGEGMPAWVGVWFPNMLFFVIAMLLIRIAPK